MEDHTLYKELSPDMMMFVTHLYNEGYFKDLNFFPRKKFDITCFKNSYGRDFVKYAAEQFSRDHQEIAKWLSGSDLKKVALFGCPSIAKKTVFSAKRLRTYFRIQEDNVCSKCTLKASCKFVNQSVWKRDIANLHLDVVMRIITPNKTSESDKLISIQLVPMVMNPRARMGSRVKSLDDSGTLVSREKMYDDFRLKTKSVPKSKICVCRNLH
ncbi:hypothetical protein HAX54_006966 [Datura stramonium]|uniref:Uncharacterized protein n=1 Tax=Datura stramonium TaxID=4076 RepID=A0ABS8TDK8_DATST|nr:hypothetical protein [Datura stramonium]